MGWQDDVETGYAARAAAACGLVWDPAGTDSTVIRGPLTATVVPGIGVQAYRVGPDDPVNPTSQLRIQFLIRATTYTGTADLAQLLYDAIHGLNGLVMGAATVTDTRALSDVPLGQNQNGNYERTCNYLVDLDLPATSLRSY
jgi:hypothetical protein